MGRQDEKHDKGRQRAEDIHPVTNTGSDRGSRPDRSRRGQPVGTVAILHDDAGAQKSDTDHNVGCHAGRLGTGNVLRDERKDARAHGHRRVGSHASFAMVPQPFQSDKSTENRGENSSAGKLKFQCPIQ